MYAIRSYYADCHDGATSWVGNTVPADNNHIDGTLQVSSGSVSFSYSGGSCGVNACHNAGDGVTPPATGSYPWGGSALANCSICHADSPTSAAHAKP